MTVVAIDPGLRVVGIAAVEHGRIAWSDSVRGRLPERAPSFADCVRAAIDVGRRVWDVIDLEGGGLEFVAEAFVDQAGRRHWSDRWKTPLVCAALAGAAPIGVELTWQDPDVLAARQYGVLYAAWKTGRRGLLTGDHVLDDEHQAAAACHALHRETVLRSGLVAR